VLEEARGTDRKSDVRVIIAWLPVGMKKVDYAVWSTGRHEGRGLVHYVRI
jgi:hypothetical protein